MDKFFSTLIFCLVVCFTIDVSAQTSETDDDAKYATELLKPGTAAPDFELKTIDGKKLKFSKFAKGKYVVLDFWASWCPDCRKDAPNINTLYEKYNSKNVKFLGVSFDTDKEKWIAGVENLKIPYTQVSELVKMSQSPVAKMYGIKWIPSIYLIDPQGNVVVGTVISDKIENKLDEIFNSQK